MSLITGIRTTLPVYEVASDGECSNRLGRPKGMRHEEERSSRETALREIGEDKYYTWRDRNELKETREEGAPKSQVDCQAERERRDVSS